MNIQMIDNFKYLPEELKQIIINYTDIIVCRHGKYLNRINKEDYRYNILEKIPKPIRLGQHRILIKLLNTNRQGYFLEYIVGMFIKINIKFVSYEIDGFDRYLETKSFIQFIFDINNKWSKIIEYSM
jgi:hypothetical protein